MELVVAIMDFNQPVVRRDSVFELAKIPSRWPNTCPVMQRVNQQPPQSADELSDSDRCHRDVQKPADRRDIGRCMSQPASDHVRVWLQPPQQNKPRQDKGDQQAEVLGGDVVHGNEATANGIPAQGINPPAVAECGTPKTLFA